MESQRKWPIYRTSLVEYKVQLAPFAVNTIKKCKWLFSLRDRVYSQKSHNHPTLIMKFVKFLTVHNKRAVRNNDLIHIFIRKNLPTLIVNFDDSKHLLAANPDLKIHMNLDKFAALNQDLSANIKKCTIFINICNVYCPFFPHALSCDQLTLHPEYHRGIFLLNNEIDMYTKNKTLNLLKSYLFLKQSFS